MLEKFTAKNLIEVCDEFSQSKHAWVLFWLTSFLIFSPLFFNFSYIVSTTDSLFNHYPNLIYGYRAMRQMSFGLWNPYIFAGTDFTTSFHDHMLNPANWFLLMVPEQYIFQFLTFIQFIEVALIGVFALKIFRVLNLHYLAALFSAMAVQLSGFTWFTTTTFISVELFFVTILMIYLILTFVERSKILNFALLSFGFCGLFLVGHLEYVGSFCLVIGSVFIFRYYQSLTRPWRYPVNIFIFSIGIAFAMSAFRWFPIFQNLHQLHFLRGAEWPESPGTMNGYFALTGLIPGVFGAYLDQSAIFFGKLGEVSRNTQMHSLLYFGIPSIFFIISAVIGDFGSKLKIMGLLVVALFFSSVFLIQPLADIIWFISAPFVEAISGRVFESFLAFIVVALITNYFIENKKKFSSLALRSLLVIAGLFLCATITFYIRLIAAYVDSESYWSYCYIIFRLLLVISFLGTMVTACKISLNSIRVSKLVDKILIASISGMLLCLLILHWYLKSHNISASWMPFLYYLSALLWIYSIHFLLKNLQTSVALFKNKFLVFSILFCIIVLLIPQGTLSSAYPMWWFYTIFSILKFLGIFFVMWELAVFSYEEKITAPVFLVITGLFLFGDMMFFIKANSYVGIPTPFMNKDQLYPNHQKIYDQVLEREASLDLWDYRINRSYYYSKDPSQAAQSNISMVYGLRTYGGVDSVVSEKLHDFIAAFEPEEGLWYSRAGIVPALDNSKLLDLMGVKYNFTDQAVPIIRSTALARFSAFSNVEEVTNLESQMKLLKSPTFNVDKTLVIDGKLSNSFSSDANFIPLVYSSPDSDHIQLNLNFQKPTVVLFDDSFSPHWQAFWNDKAISVHLADGYFMAVEVPAGQGVLKFRFHPTVFLNLVKLSVSLFSFLLILLLIDFFINRRKIY